MGRAVRRIWFERSFDLGLDLELFPELVERLRGTPARLQERVRSLSVERLTRRHEGAWSIQEHAGHLVDLEALWLGRIDDLVAGQDRLRAADLENRATWDANHNGRPIAGILEDFRQQRTTFVERVESMGPEQLAAEALHPRLEQPMTVVDLCFFVAEHDDHHLATITALRGRASPADG